VKRSFWDSNWALVGLIVLVGSAALAPLAWVLAHPCVRYEASTCSECAQTMYLPDADGLPTIPVCVSWEDVPCRICAERAP
jgi:hypothetical protein